MDLSMVNGRRGKSKADVKLSVNTAFGALWVHVWEGGKITHTFNPDREFAEAFATAAEACGLLAPAPADTVEASAPETGKPLIDIL